MSTNHHKHTVVEALLKSILYPIAISLAGIVLYLGVKTKHPPEVAANMSIEVVSYMGLLMGFVLLLNWVLVLTGDVYLTENI